MAAGLSLVPVAAWAQDPPAQTSPDNTRTNKRDRAQGEPTADQQKENTADRQLARQVRRALIADKDLSTYGHNIKVIARDGVVTLKGPVHTEDEKRAIEAKAAEVAGKDKIHNELSVTGQ